MRGRVIEAVVGVAGLIAGRSAFAATGAPNAAAPMAHLGLATQPVQLPGAGQVIFVFLCVAALAVGMAWALRRLSPGILARLKLPSGGVEVTVLGRQRLEPGVNLHIVSVAGERLAIVSGRSGVAMHALSSSGTSASGPAPVDDRDRPSGAAVAGDRVE